MFEQRRQAATHKVSFPKYFLFKYSTFLLCILFLKVEQKERLSKQSCRFCFMHCVKASKRTLACIAFKTKHSERTLLLRKSTGGRKALRAGNCTAVSTPTGDAVSLCYWWRWLDPNKYTNC